MKKNEMKQKVKVQKVKKRRREGEKRKEKEKVDFLYFSFDLCFRCLSDSSMIKNVENAFIAHDEREIIIDCPPFSHMSVSIVKTC